MDVTKFRERVRELEARSGLNEKNYADNLGLKLTTYRNIKGPGEQGPALSTLLAMFTKLSKSEIEYLIFDDTELPSPVPKWLVPYVDTLEDLNAVDQGRVLGALQLLGIIKSSLDSDTSGEENQIAVAGAPRNRNGTR